MTVDGDSSHVFPGNDGVSEVVAGDADFWALPEAEIEKAGHGWLVFEFSCPADRPNREMHSNTDELVDLPEGDAEFLLEHDSGLQRHPVRGRGTGGSASGIWHVARVHAPSRMLCVTMGSGTRRRPAAKVGCTPAPKRYAPPSVRLRRFR
jgi:hypothetical protein